MDADPLSGLGLHPVTLTDRSRFDAAFRSLNEPLSDYTFSQIFTWGNSLRIFWKELSGNLCVFANGTGDLTLLVPPIGEGRSDRALAEAFEIMDAYNRAHDADGRSRAEYVSEELLCRLDRSALRVEPMGADYVYDVRRMIDLAGGDLASKRQLKSRFLRLYDHRVEPYDPALHRSACGELLRRWKHMHDAQHPAEAHGSAIKRQKETLACELTLDHAADLGLEGLVVYVRPRPHIPGSAGEYSLAAFTFGELLGPDQSSILIEKTDLSVRGLAQFIFSEFCRRCWSDRPLVNAGDDWGLKSLAWTKMSYRPVKMLQKYTIRQAQRVSIRVPATVSALSELEGAPEPAVVRLASREDLAAAVELEKNCFSAYSLTKRQLQYLSKRKSATFLVAQQGGRIVGEGICLVRHHKKGQSGRIYSLAVDQTCRRQRLGEKLLKAMVDSMASRGVRRVYLEVEQANAPAIGLYQRNGFRSIGTLPDYYGQGRHGVHMMCEIPAAT